MSIRHVTLALVAAWVLHSAPVRATEHLSPVHMQRYCMGTMFDIVVYHGSRSDGVRAVGDAMAEIFRLDQVLSHFKADSDLSMLVRAARRGVVTAEPSLYEVIQQALATSRVSGGKFDITIAPLLRIWKEAQAQGRKPSDAQILAARQCVGFDKIETRAPSAIWFRSDCLELDLGGIGKGYAVDRAMRVLRSAGIRHALINAGGSSIAAIGSPPGRTGWPVSVGTNAPDRMLLLQDTSISTSQQILTAYAFDSGEFGDIIDPSTGAPAASRTAVRVVAPSATLSDALSTALIMMSRDEASQVLAKFPNVSAMWISAAGELQDVYRESQLRFADSR